MDLIRECLAKPSGITLRKHHENVKQEGLNLISSCAWQFVPYDNAKSISMEKSIVLIGCILF